MVDSEYFSDENIERMKDKARKQGQIEVFNLIKKYHSPKSLGFELWNKIENKILSKQINNQMYSSIILIDYKFKIFNIQLFILFIFSALKLVKKINQIK